MNNIAIFLFLCLSNLFYGQSPNDVAKSPKSQNLSPVDFGAIGDGVSNDYAPFQKAVEWASKSNNKKLFIPNNYKFNLGNQTIDFTKIPSGIILDFEGGVVMNANLVGLNTKIDAARIKIFENVKLSGTFLSAYDAAYPEWFGGFPNDVQYDLVDALKKLDPVFSDFSLGIGDYFTSKGEYMIKGLRGVSMAGTKVVLLAEKPNTYLFSMGKVGGAFKDRNYDFNYITDLSIVITQKRPGIKLKGIRGVIIGAAHKPRIENVRIKQSEEFQRFTKNDLQLFLSNQNKVNDANVGIEFRGDSEVTHLSNVFTLADVGILFSQYTDIVYVSDYMNWCGVYGLANVYFRKEAVQSQNILFTGTQSWNQGLYGFYSEDSDLWNTFRNNKYENVRIEQLTKEITQNGKVASTSIRIGKSNLIASPIFENVILSGASNGIYLGETTSGNIYFEKINLYPDITIKRDFAIKTKFLKPSTSPYETPLKVYLKQVDLYTDSDSYFENSTSAGAKSADPAQKNRFTDEVFSYK